ncbi:MAG: endonuclease [Paludibacteraceae bacterium]|nr:endonuclease [Paludibacteraceae bacterium]
MMFERVKIVGLLFLLGCAIPAFCQERIRIMSYNVENFFDTKDDTLKDDIAFTPEGDYHWTQARYKAKSGNIAKVITAVGEWDGVAIVGLCEVENDYVLNTLTRYSPLKNAGYRYIHYESRDPRGIDVAMLYNPKQVKVVESRPIQISCTGKSKRSRDVLYAKTVVFKRDTLHIFICHTPSRIGGAEKSSWKRECVTSAVKVMADSINYKGNANIVIMGDFNDTPDCKSMAEALNAKYPDENHIDSKSLYNMFWKYHDDGRGSYKFKGEWDMLDQIIVSGNLLKSNTFYTTQNDAVIFDADFIMEDDVKFSDKKPSRTYNGRKYIGGYSDHLPIYIDLFRGKPKK